MSFSVPSVGASGVGNIRIDKLNLSNYLTWRIEMEQVLQMRGAWDVLHHPRPVVPDGQAPPVPPPNLPQGAAAALGGGAGMRTELFDPASPSLVDQRGLQRPSAGGGAPASGDAAAQQAAAQYAAALQQHRQREAVRAQHESAVREWERQNVMARGLIILSLDPVHQLVARRHSAARDIWAALERDFRSRGMARAAMLRTQLDTLKKGATEAMLEYAARARTIQWELTELGEEASDRSVLIAMLHGLPKQYDVTKGILEDKNASMEAAMPTLITAEQRIQMEAATPANTQGDSGVALASVDDRQCFGCGRRGHYMAECRSIRNNGWGRAAPTRGAGHSRDSYSRRDTRNRGPRREARRTPGNEARHTQSVPPGGGAHALTARVVDATPFALGSTATLSAPQEWVIDSGASHHMTNDLAAMVDATTIDPVPIRMANGESRLATHSGQVYVQSKTDKGVKSLVMHDTLFVPGLSSNLFSVPRAVRNGTRGQHHGRPHQSHRVYTT